MNFALYIFPGLIGLGLIGLTWRIFSHRQELPCPPWLGRMVEMDNSFTEVNRWQKTGLYAAL